MVLLLFGERERERLQDNMVHKAARVQVLSGGRLHICIQLCVLFFMCAPMGKKEGRVLHGKANSFTSIAMHATCNVLRVLTCEHHMAAQCKYAIVAVAHGTHACEISACAQRRKARYAPTCSKTQTSPGIVIVPVLRLLGPIQYWASWIELLKQLQSRAKQQG